MKAMTDQDILNMDADMLIWTIGEFETQLEAIRRECTSALNLTLTPRAHRDVLKRIKRMAR